MRINRQDAKVAKKKQWRDKMKVGQRPILISLGDLGVLAVDSRYLFKS